jgi:hypothetical protein
VELVGVDEGGEVVGVGRGDDVEWILVELEIGFFAVAECWVGGEVPACRFLFYFTPGMW